MNYTPINGFLIRMNFYTSFGCVLEDVIENHFYNYFEKACPCVRGRKESIAGRPTDGIIRFYNENNDMLFWVLQETKRDKGITSVEVPRSFLQTLMYLGNIYYDTNPLGVDKFRGIFLDSARYFCFIPRETVDEVMKKFEPLWNKYWRVSPSKAYKEAPELESFAKLAFYTSKIYKFELDENFRLDLLLKDMYENKI